MGAVTGLARAQGIRPIPYRMDPRAPGAAKRLELVTLFDSAYQRPRRIWVYTPAGYAARAATTYPLMIAFDGSDYRDTMPLPFILDTLLAPPRTPAFIGRLWDHDA